MSNAPQESGWWLASDGKWYPPSTRADGRGATRTEARPESDVIRRVLMGVLVALVLLLGGWMLWTQSSEQATVRQECIDAAVVGSPSPPGCP
jgi:hypothetical protein